MHAVAALAWALAVAADPLAPDAPLGLRTEGPLRLLFLDVTLADARAPRTVTLDARWSLANSWSMPTLLQRGDTVVELTTDEQSDALAFAARVPWAALLGDGGGGLTQRLSTTLEGRLALHWGGWTDGVIEWWHRLLQTTNFRRQIYPRYATRVVLRDLAGPALAEVRGPTLALGDLALRTQLTVAEGGASVRDPSQPARALALRLDVKVPVGSLARLGGSGGWDVGLAASGTAELADWLTGHAQLAASVFSGLPAGFPLQPRRWHVSAEISLAFHFGEVTLLLEDRFLSPLFEGGWERVPGFGNLGYISSSYFAAFRPHNQVSVGVRAGGFSFWVSEDFTPGPDPHEKYFYYDSNAPDIVIGVAWSKAL